MKIFFLIVLFSFSTFLQAAEKPNIIVIYTDDHGWPDIGAAGIYDDLKTPHLDALAASGVRATNGYSTAPQCVPSRAGLLAGRSQSRFGVESNGADLTGFNEQLTIAERLKTVGYATGQIGKWHLGQNNLITDHGFDDVYAKNANRPCFANYTFDGKIIPGQMVDDKEYHLDACSRAAVSFVKRHSGKPFFLYLAYRAPHVPLDAPEKYLSRFPGDMPERRRQALAMISAMDDGVGQIVAELRNQKVEKDTLIFYIGDNGAPLKIHKLDAPGGGPGWDGSLNEPMNGEKGMLTEGGIRVPFVISWPGSIPAGLVWDQPVWTLDVAATAVELAGMENDDSLDGINLIPVLKSKELKPPGIDTSEMSQTWEDYFDHYLEGKKVSVRQKGDDKVRDWVVRNGSMIEEGGTMKVSAKKKDKRPFIANSSWKMQGSFPVDFEINPSNSGVVGIAWRLNTQKDFPKEQNVTQKVKADGDFQNVSFAVPAKGKTVHIRILLPKGDSAIRSVKIGGKAK